MPSPLRKTLLACIFAVGGLSQYVLEDDYFSGNFFDHWTFFTDADPTHGYVTYVDRPTAIAKKLIVDNTAGAPVYIGVDYDNVLDPKVAGRSSVRISSVKTYNNGLFILDLAHMPGGACGIWPAFWSFGDNWPNRGEIDIIEGIHQQTVNDMTYHTNEGCTLTPGGFSADVLTTNCWVQAPGQTPNLGCSTQSTDAGTYGDSFNHAVGGVYAMEWTSAAISIWFFPREGIPADITAGTPDPSTWHEPLSQLRGGSNCDIPTHFVDHNLVFDITFCGDWAGGVWNTSSCAAKAATCEDYVANTPQFFASTFWSINGLKVYSNGNTAPGSLLSVAAPAPTSRKPAPKGKPAVFNADNKQLPLSPHGSRGSRGATHSPVPPKSGSKTPAPVRVKGGSGGKQPSLRPAEGGSSPQRGPTSPSKKPPTSPPNGSA